MKKIYLALFLVLSLFLTACDPLSIWWNAETSEKVQKLDIDNKKVDANKEIKTDKNKIWVSNGNKYIGFVATWCPHCQAAVPTLEKFASKTNGQIEINVVNKKPFPWVKNLKENYENPKTYKDYTNEECGYVPSYVIVDKNGKVIEKKCGGSLDYEQLKAKLLKSWNNQEENLNSNNWKKMEKTVVSNGDTIKVDYIGKFEDGKVFDTSIEEEAKKAGKYNPARPYKPLEFTVGMWKMIPCFDKWVVGMKLGETKEIKCEPKDAYGECSKDKIIKVEKSKLAEFEKQWIKIEKWSELPTQYGMLKITDVKDGIVYIDTNHPLCWKKLIFTVTVKEIK